MDNLQEIFNRILEVKKEQKTLQSACRDALTNTKSYQEVVEKIKLLREEKKKIEGAIQTDLKAELSKLEALKQDIESDKIMMSDLALNELAHGKTVEVTDKYANKYEPIFSVKFKKI
jgi:hypothetical protein